MFFDDYPKFTNPDSIKVNIKCPNRLNHRHIAIIENNIQLFPGAKILDIASFDCHWTLAAIKAGANHVTAIEQNTQYINEAKTLLAEYEIDPSKYTIINADIHTEIEKFNDQQFDLALNCGYFYHTLEHLQLLRECKRVAKCMILDTVIYMQSAKGLPQSEQGLIKINHEGYHIGQFKKVIGIPNKCALELLLKEANFNDWYYVDWHKLIQDTTRLEDYINGRRITLLAR